MVSSCLKYMHYYSHKAMTVYCLPVVHLHVASWPITNHIVTSNPKGDIFIILLCVLHTLPHECILGVIMDDDIATEILKDFIVASGYVNKQMSTPSDSAMLYVNTKHPATTDVCVV